MATLEYRVSNGTVYRCEECGDTFTALAGESADCPMCKPAGAGEVNSDGEKWCGRCNGGILAGDFCTCEVGRNARAVSNRYAALGDAGDDDPVCVCGTYRSEHALCGCGDWQRAR